MVSIVWQFNVKRGREAEFEQLYGADGERTTMNRHTREYLGSSFLRDQSEPSRYLVIEYWSEMLVAEQHNSFRPAALIALDGAEPGLLESTEPLGVLPALDVPAH